MPPPIQPPPPATSTLAPSDSTVYSGLSGAITVIVVWALGAAGVTVPPEISVSIGVIVTTVVGYVAKGGRNRDVKPKEQQT